MTSTGTAAQKLIFAPVFDALLKGVGDRATAAFHQEVRALGVRAEKLLPGYDYEVWEKAVLAAARLFDELSHPDAVAEVGRRITHATVAASPVGKTLMPMLKLMGTARALKRIYSRSTGENFNKVTFGVEQPRSLEMLMSYVGTIPDMSRGSVVAIGELMGIDLRAKVLRHEPPEATYLIEW